jgi:hypothetical protein
MASQDVNGSPVDRPAASDARLARGAAPEGEGSIVRLVGDLLGGGAPGQTMLSALVAWAITVAPAAFSRVGAPYARLLSLVALATGVAGPLLRRERPELGRHLGITAFLALCTGAWLGASAALQPARLDPLRAAVGAVAWGAFALSWRDRWSEAPRNVEPSRDGERPLLQARTTLPRGAIPIAAAGVVAAIVLIVLAWNVQDADRALAAHAIAVACAVSVITVAAAVAVNRGKRSSRGSRRFTAPAVKAVLTLLVLVVAGVAILALRGR